MSYQKVQEVNKILLAGEPANISVDDHGGTTYTGYKPQAVLDAMNTVFWGEWGFTKVSEEIVSGEKGGLAVAEVSVWIKGNDFQPVAWGQNRVTRGDIGDGKKGAQTDAIKKALSYFSIGNRAYHGLLEKPANTPKPRPSASVVRQSDGKVNKDRLNTVYATGKKAGLYANLQEFNGYCLFVLGLDILASAQDLTDAQASAVEAAIVRRHAQAS